MYWLLGRCRTDMVRVASYFGTQVTLSNSLLQVTETNRVFSMCIYKQVKQKVNLTFDMGT